MIHAPYWLSQPSCTIRPVFPEAMSDNWFSIIPFQKNLRKGLPSADQMFKLMECCLIDWSELWWQHSSAIIRSAVFCFFQIFQSWNNYCLMSSRGKSRVKPTEQTDPQEEPVTCMCMRKQVVSPVLVLVFSYVHIYPAQFTLNQLCIPALLSDVISSGCSSNTDVP